MTASAGSRARWLLLGVIGLFVVGRFFGGLLGDNAWSFRHWDSVSTLFPVFWLLCFVGLALFAYYRQEKLGQWFRSPISVTVPLVVLVTLFWVFRFDTFLFGAGNLRVGEIASFEQVGSVVVYRWYEFGCTALAHGVYRLLTATGLEPDVAGANAWRLLTYLSTILAMLASVQVARLLSRDHARRVFTFVIVFFGGQTLLYFGYIGMEPIVVPVTLWFAYLACRLQEPRSKRPLGLLWLLLAVGIVMHVSMIYLLPAAVYLTVSALGGNDRAKRLALAAGILGYVVLLAGLYMQSSQSFGLQARLLLLSGKPPFLDYGLLSLRHIADLLQILFLAVPTIVVVKLLTARRLRKLVSDQTMMTGWLMALGGTTAVIVLDPTNSMPIDFPRLLAYLSPFGFVAALVLNDADQRGPSGRLQLLPLAATAALMFPLSYLPTYTDIERADPYVNRYLSRHDDYYREACFSFRDAYFYVRNYDKSTEWEQAAERKSPDRINLTGSAYLIAGGNFSDGIKTLHQLIARNRYWAEPRSLLARAQMASGQYGQALPQIDTALMLEPVGRQHVINRYECYRDMGKYDEALAACERGLSLFPADTFMTTDKMILHYRAGQYRRADSVADALLASRPGHAYARFIKGALADRAGNRTEAVKNYQLFLERAKDDPDVPRVRERIRQLTAPAQSSPDSLGP